MVDNAVAEPSLAFNLAKELKDKKIAVMVIGIGPYAVEAELRRIASSEETLFMVDSYDRLGAIQKPLLDVFCGSQ